MSSAHKSLQEPALSSLLYSYYCTLFLHGPQYAPDKNDNRFTYKEYEKAWLGEQGKKLGESFVGLDDFTLILPDYDTSFHAQYGQNVLTGSFGDVFAPEIYLCYH